MSGRYGLRHAGPSAPTACLRLPSRERRRTCLSVVLLVYHATHLCRRPIHVLARPENRSVIRALRKGPAPVPSFPGGWWLCDPTRFHTSNRVWQETLVKHFYSLRQRKSSREKQPATARAACVFDRMACVVTNVNVSGRENRSRLLFRSRA